MVKNGVVEHAALEVHFQQEGVAIIKLQAEQFAVLEPHRLIGCAFQLGIAQVAALEAAFHEGGVGKVGASKVAVGEAAVLVLSDGEGLGGVVLGGEVFGFYEGFGHVDFWG